ncbi:unnamed protein product [Brassica oleracea]
MAAALESSPEVGSSMKIMDGFATSSTAINLPRLRFNKEGNLLAVTTADNGFKILTNADGLRTLGAYEVLSYEASKAFIDMKVPTSAMVSSMSPASIGKVEHMDTDSPARPTPVHKPLELTEIVDPTQCRQVTMPDSKDSVSKVARLLYTNSGVGVLALEANGVQRLWKWSRNEQNPTGKATASVTPQHWQPNSGLLMANDVPENPETAVPCIALSKNDSYVKSACGGKVSLFNMMTFKVMTTFMPPPPASTFLAFHPQDNNIIAIGMEDSSIHIYNVRVDEVKTKLKGHQKHITGLAFSTALNTLVSSGADAQLFFWTADSWEKKKSSVIQLPPGKAPVGDTRVQFHNDQIHLLVSHETQLAIYDASKMECIHKWVPQEALSSPITSASYSCNSQLVYASFTDGNIAVFDAESLRLRCRIAPSAYMPQPNRYLSFVIIFKFTFLYQLCFVFVCDSAPIIPQVITAHPQEPNQLANGLSDGSVKVIEPSEASRRWGVGVAVTADKSGAENGRPSSSSAANNSTSDHQIQR